MDLITHWKVSYAERPGGTHIILVGFATLKQAIERAHEISEGLPNRIVTVWGHTESQWRRVATVCVSGLDYPYPLPSPSRTDTK